MLHGVLHSNYCGTLGQAQADLEGETEEKLVKMAKPTDPE